jgi:hypothetical protein
MMAGREGEGPATSGTCKKINRKRKKRPKESGSWPGYHH